MSERKPFAKLSERQKRRRINNACRDAFNEIDSEHEVGQDTDEAGRAGDVEDERSENPQNNRETSENFAADEENLLHSDFQNYAPVDLINIEFNKLLNNINNSDTDESIDEDGRSDSDSDTGNEDSHEQSIKNRLGEWASDGSIADNRVNNLLTILHDAGLTYLPKDVRSLRTTPKTTLITTCQPGEYFHYGLKKALTDTLTKCGSNYQNKEIEIDINIDGLPITKSPQKSLWPILGKIVDDVHKQVFVIGAYHGTQKPKSPSTFLKPFIDEYTNIRENGLIYNGKKFQVLIRCLICDSPAASFILCIKQFNGYYGCRKCHIKGQWKTRMVFLNEEEPLRTNESFRSRLQEQHHNGSSAFERINFDMVAQVPLDYMHLVCLGVMKLLLRLWIMPRVNPQLNAIQLDQLSNYFLSISPWIPIEFARKGQSLLELNRWKATTLRLFLLYIGPIILQNILPSKYMMHFNTLHCSIRILCNPVHCLQYNDYSKKLLIYFVREMKTLYGAKWISWNVHNLIHLPEDAKKFGCLDNYSSFPFENHMQILKRILRKKGQPLQQIHRRLTEKSNFLRNDKGTKCTSYPSMQRPTSELLPEGYHSRHKSLKFPDFELKDCRPDNCCITDDDEIILISYICKMNNQNVIIGRQYVEKENIDNYPLPSTNFGICKVNILSENKVVPVDNIRNKACLFFHQKNCYVVPLLHHNIW